jgi:hypothetical protein
MAAAPANANGTESLGQHAMASPATAQARPLNRPTLRPSLRAAASAAVRDLALIAMLDSASAPKAPTNDPGEFSTSTDSDDDNSALWIDEAFEELTLM